MNRRNLKKTKKTGKKGGGIQTQNNRKDGQRSMLHVPQGGRRWENKRERKCRGDYLPAVQALVVV